MSFNIGENVGPYRIIEQLGQGGMATVYKAYHASLDRYVALKVLHPAFNQDQTFTMRFQREARVVARLEHQNIVPVYDYSEHEARPYLVMKYIEGDTLKARLNQGPLTSEEIEKVVNSVGYALAYAHRQGILHRDIKPSNVMIATDGVMYLADFGLARIAQAGESTMSSDSIMGTPQYISPEQAMGKKDLDAGTDIYSFGVMLYEMVVGQVPFTADTPFSIIHDHIYTPLPLPMTVNPDVPEPVQRVLLKSLAKDRVDRYATVEELIRAFKDAWIESGVPMHGTAITVRPTAFVKSDKATSATAQHATPLADVTEAAAAKSYAIKKLRSPWMLGGIGVAVLLCCIASVFVIRNNRLVAAPPTITPTLALPTFMPTQTQTPPLPTSTFLPLRPTFDPFFGGGENPNNGDKPGSGPGGGGPPGGGPPLPLNASPEVKAAVEAVNKDPRSSDAHLQLSLAFFDMKETNPAIDELTHALNMADKNQPDFFIKAGEEYKKREAWAFAASAYMRLFPIYRNATMPEDLKNNAREAIYKSVEDKNASAFGFLTHIENASQEFAPIMRGRYALYNGNIEEAKNQLDQFRKLYADMPEARLLEAEIEMQNDKEKAIGILKDLVADAATPQWARLMAENYLKQ